MRNSIILLGAIAIGCGEGVVADDGQSGLRPRVTIDPRHSLMITDRAVLDSTRGLGSSRFSMRRVLDELSRDTGSDGALEMFRQLWDTQNPAPGYTGRGPHCDDTLINGHPLGCRPLDGLQAKDTSGEILDGYFPIALVNRFDLAPPDGATCGEYRIVYSKGPQLPGRSLVIFEAALANPKPEDGLAACGPVQKLWARLSSPEMTAASRAELLDELYFTGIDGFPPVIRAEAFAMDGGQIRTNTFMDRPWSLRELKLAPSGEFIPVSVKANPLGRLFGGADANAISFQAGFVDNVAKLSVPDVASIGYESAPDTYNAPASTDNVDLDFSTWFSKGRPEFRTAIQARLDASGSSLTPEHIVRRARTQSCMGCHQRTNNLDLGDGLVWPRSLGFVHVSETLEDGPEGPRYKISAALAESFLPARKHLMETFLGYGPQAIRANGPTLSGAVH